MVLLPVATKMRRDTAFFFRADPPASVCPTVELGCHTAPTLPHTKGGGVYHMWYQLHTILSLATTMNTAASPPPPPATDTASTVLPLQIPRGVEYRCGDCGARTHIKGGDPIRCRQCGFRILYKTRTKRCK